MLENLRKKSLVKTYSDPRYSINFEQGHAIYLNSLSIAEHKQILSKKKVDKAFSSTFDGGSKEFRLIANTLEDVQFNMIYCPSGTFTMGHRDQDDNQPREETIERPFLLGETEITQELYEKVMGTNPSEFKNPQNPIEQVLWEDTILFCNELSRLQGLDLCYTKNSDEKYDWLCEFKKNGYRLPTEKEWEYAAKAGTNNEYAGTNKKEELFEYAWLDYNSRNQTHPVAKKKPNEWGFYDMSGNVWEWCWDKYDFPDEPDNRAARGGGWNNNNSVLCSACCGYGLPSEPISNFGFRVCRSIVN